MNFAVSGMLWKRSLVMVDKETQTLWAHLPGLAMRGTLKGRKLTAIPSTMTSWKSWREQHPKTTVLNMKRTSRSFVREYYRKPKQFVFGWRIGVQAWSVGLDVLLEKRVLNTKHEQHPRVVVFDQASTAAAIYSARVGDDVLTFASAGPGIMKDAATGSTWNVHTGKAVAGPLQGRQLKPRVGIMSFRRAWDAFHPKNRVVSRINTTQQEDRAKVPRLRRCDGSAEF